MLNITKLLFKSHTAIGFYVKTMSAHGSHLGWRSYTGHNFESILPKDHPCYVCFKLADWFQRRRFLNNYPIGSYVKTMSADGGHFELRSGSLNTILEVDHLRTIHAMFALNWLTGFRGDDLHIIHRVLC